MIKASSLCAGLLTGCRAPYFMLGALLIAGCAGSGAPRADAPAAVARTAAPARIPVADLQARHRLPISKFTNIAGVPIHYTDEGTGPVIVLLHGSYLDLTSWDDWVAEFRRDHRIIRLDRIRFGLSGSFPDRPPDYAAEQVILDGLVDQLKLDKFMLVGSSSGGVVAAQYADRHPERVSRLVLMNFPLGHGRIQAMNSPAAPATPAPVNRQTPQERMTQLLEYNLVDHSVITPDLLARLSDFSNREDPSGAIAAAFGRASSFAEDDRAAMLGRLQQPALVIWSDRNRTLPVAEGQAAFEAMGSRTKHFTVIQNAGHMVPLEAGRTTARLARQFAEGKALPAEVASDG